MPDANKDSGGVPPIPVAVIGCGRMGRLHARVYSEMPNVRLVGVSDADGDRAALIAEEFNCAVLEPIGDLPKEVRAASIAVPTNSHLAVAERCLSRGIACLIEKPLARDVAEAQQIVDCAKRTGVAVQVGHIERFNPAVRAMTRLDVKPRFIEVSRISPMTFRSIDVGVVLDMMIHDIDIVLRLAGSRVAKIDAIGVSVIGTVEDICNARLIFENGCVANITASRLSLKTERKLRIFSPDAYVSLDYQKKYGIVARRSHNLDAIREAVDRIHRGEVTDLSELNFADLVQIEELKIDDIEPLRAELDSFIEAVTNGTAPPVSAEEGLAAVDTATRIIAAIASNKL